MIECKRGRRRREGEDGGGIPRDAQWGLASYTRAGHLAVPSGRWAGWWDILPVFVVGWGCL